MIEAYRLAFAHIEELLDRRQSTTSFYFSVNTAIIAIVGLLIKDSGLSGIWLAISLLVLLCAGEIACWLWRTLLHQYEVLLDWWYTRLRELEVNLPESSRLVTREYQEFYGGKKKASSVQMGIVDKEI
jgi:hypothetical protein